MNKLSANVLFGLCLALSALITYASDLAYSGKQPVLWINIAAFFVGLGLVALGITIKTKFKQR